MARCRHSDGERGHSIAYCCLLPLKSEILLLSLTTAMDLWWRWSVLTLQWWLTFPLVKLVHERIITNVSEAPGPVKVHNTGF